MYTIIYVLRSPVRGPVYLCLCSVCDLVCDPVVLWSCGPSVPLRLRWPSGHQREPAAGVCVWSCPCGPVVCLYLCVSAGPQDIRESQQQESVCGPVVCLYLCVSRSLCVVLSLWSCGPSVPLCLHRPSGHQREPAAGVCVWSCGSVVLWSVCTSVSPPALRTSERASNRSLCVVLSLWSCGPVVRLYLCVSTGPQDIRESQQQESVCGPMVLWSCGPPVPLRLRRPSGQSERASSRSLCVVLWFCGPVVLWSVCTSVSPPALRTPERASSRSLCVVLWSVCTSASAGVCVWSCPCGPSVPLCLRRPSGHQREPAAGVCVWSCGLSVPLRQQESVCSPVPVVLWSVCTSASPPALRTSERASSRSLCVVLWSVCTSASAGVCVVLSLWSCGPSVPLRLRRPSGHQREPAAGVCVWSCGLSVPLRQQESVCSPVPVVLWSVCTSASPPALRTSERASSKSLCVVLWSVCTSASAGVCVWSCPCGPVVLWSCPCGPVVRLYLCVSAGPQDIRESQQQESVCGPVPVVLWSCGPSVPLRLRRPSGHQREPAAGVVRAASGGRDGDVGPRGG